MTDYRELERRLAESLDLGRRPVAVAFRDAAPAGVPKFEGVQPSGCSFWRLAMEGRTFYTVPSDHYNCPVGSHTHGITLPPERVAELEGTLSLMASAGYLRMEEIPGIARLPRAPAAVVYAPLGDAPLDPDAVIVAGRPGRVMLLQEAAVRAGVGPDTALLGRPTCMALPASLGRGAVASTGCIGNRVYTGLGDDELYVVVRGADMPRVVAELGTITAANAALASYHRDRRRSLGGE
jgi:uncharacterized protein (DUF169 family)